MYRTKGEPLEFVMSCESTINTNSEALNNFFVLRLHSTSEKEERDNIITKEKNFRISKIPFPISEKKLPVFNLRWCQWRSQLIIPISMLIVEKIYCILLAIPSDNVKLLKILKIEGNDDGDKMIIEVINDD